jgi:hypothetical protein
MNMKKLEDLLLEVIIEAIKNGSLEVMTLAVAFVMVVYVVGCSVAGIETNMMAASIIVGIAAIAVTYGWAYSRVRKGIDTKQP